MHACEGGRPGNEANLQVHVHELTWYVHVHCTDYCERMGGGGGGGWIVLEVTLRIRLLCATTQSREYVGMVALPALVCRHLSPSSSSFAADMAVHLHWMISWCLSYCGREVTFLQMCRWITEVQMRTSSLFWSTGVPVLSKSSFARVI